MCCQGSGPAIVPSRPGLANLRRVRTTGVDAVLGPRAFYALALLLIVGGVAAYTRDPDWNLPTGPKAARVASPSGGQAAGSDSNAATATAAAGSGPRAEAAKADDAPRPPAAKAARRRAAAEADADRRDNGRRV